MIKHDYLQFSIPLLVLFQQYVFVEIASFVRGGASSKVTLLINHKGWLVMCKAFFRNNFHGFLLDSQFSVRLVIHFTLYFGVFINSSYNLSTDF